MYHTLVMRASKVSKRDNYRAHFTKLHDSVHEYGGSVEIR